MSKSIALRKSLLIICLAFLAFNTSFGTTIFEHGFEDSDVGGFCGVNQHVVSNTCVACPAGTTNAPGDNASGENTSCDATLCAADQHVVSNTCVACPAGTTNAPGDNASGEDTACDPDI